MRNVLHCLKHRPVQHRDRKPPWCDNCGLTATGMQPMSIFQKEQTMDPNDFQGKAKEIAFNYIKERLEKTDSHVTFSRDEVYVVWFAKVLQNWKVLISTSLPDGMYYELTYNGDKGETYLDAYKKWDNVAIPD